MPQYQVNWHHKILCDALDRMYEGTCKRLMVFMPPRAGKALEVNTPIPTHDGWKEIGRLEVGDRIFDENGQVCSVVATSPIWKDRKLYRVEADDGSFVLADGEHEWNVRLCRKRPVWKKKTTKYLFDRLSDRNPMIPRNGALVLPFVDLPIDPYVLGVWLGDGFSDHATITAHDDESSFFRSEFDKRGYKTTDRSTRFTFGVLGLITKLKENNLHNNKHVPQQYFRASIEQRKELVRGLIDTDGYVSPVNGMIEFCNTNLQLAESVRELVHSLGYKCSLRTGEAKLNGRLIGPKYRVNFFAPDLCSLPRKLKHCINPQKPNRYLTIEEAGVGDTVCIQVDSPSHLFLAGKGMMPTHNSELVSRRFPAYVLGRNPDADFITCSYSDSLAGSMNRDVQRIIDSKPYQELFPKTTLNGRNIRTLADGSYLRNSDMFEIVGHKGVYKSAGVGTGITGRGFTFGFIDDYFKDDEEAQSQTIRDKIWEWYTTTFLTRQGPDARIAIICTRWHYDDLAGRLLELEKTDPDADKWEVISFPAIATKNIHPLDPRKEGEPIWPARKIFDLPHLRSMRSAQGTKFEALYQQSPTKEGGNHFKDFWFRTYRTDGEWFICEGKERINVHDCSIFFSIDPAASEEETADNTGLIMFAHTPRNELLILDVIAERLGIDGIIPRTMDMVRKWNPEFGGCESTGFQSAIVKEMRKIDGMPPIREMKHEGKGKLSRATPAIILAESGAVYLPPPIDAPWREAFLRELTLFTGIDDPHDDQVDAFAYGVWMNSRLDSIRDSLLDRPEEREHQYLPEPHSYSEAGKRGLFGRH